MASNQEMPAPSSASAAAPDAASCNPPPGPAVPLGTQSRSIAGCIVLEGTPIAMPSFPNPQQAPGPLQPQSQHPQASSQSAFQQATQGNAQPTHVVGTQGFPSGTFQHMPQPPKLPNSGRPYAQIRVKAEPSVLVHSSQLPLHNCAPVADMARPLTSLLNSSQAQQLRQAAPAMLPMGTLQGPSPSSLIGSPPSHTGPLLQAGHAHHIGLSQRTQQNQPLHGLSVHMAAGPKSSHAGMPQQGPCGTALHGIRPAGSAHPQHGRSLSDGQLSYMSASAPPGFGGSQQAPFPTDLAASQMQPGHQQDRLEHSAGMQSGAGPAAGPMGMPALPTLSAPSSYHPDSPQRAMSYQGTPFAAMSPPFPRYNSGPPVMQPHGHASLSGPGQSAPAEFDESGLGMEYRLGSAGPNKSRYRGVSYDKKKRKWRVQIKVANLGKSGVSVGYYDTEEAAAKAYDRAAIGLLGRDNCSITTNFPLTAYDQEPVPHLIGKSRDEVKATLKTERAKWPLQAPRRRSSSRQRTSRYMGVGSSNRKNQWQARILVYGKVTHLGYYETEDEAARVYDRVSISLHGSAAQTNFPAEQYSGEMQQQFAGMGREELQRALGVKPMDKSSRFRGVSKKKGKWEAKVMVNRKWAYRELFDSESDAAHAYDRAVWELKPKEAKSYVNFKDRCMVNNPCKPIVLQVLQQARYESDSDEALSSPSSSMSSLPHGLPASHAPFAPSSGCMLTAEDILGNIPSSMNDSLEPAQSPTAVYMQPPSQAMSQHLSGHMHRGHHQQLPQSPPKAKRALFPTASSSRSMLHMGGGGAAGNHMQQTQPMQRQLPPEVRAKADAIYQRARECFEADQHQLGGQEPVGVRSNGLVGFRGDEAPVYSGRMPAGRQGAPSRLSSSSVVLPPSPFLLANPEQQYGGYQQPSYHHRRGSLGGEPRSSPALDSVPEGHVADGDRPIHRSWTLPPTLEMRSEVQDESNNWISVPHGMDVEMEPGEPPEEDSAFDLCSPGWPTQLAGDLQPMLPFPGHQGLDQPDHDLYSHSQTNMEEGSQPASLNRSQSAHQLPSPSPADPWDRFQEEHQVRNGPGNLGRSVSLSQLPKPSVRFTINGQPGLTADRETALRACNLIVQQLGLHSQTEQAHPQLAGLQCPPQPSSPFGDLQIGGDPIGLFGSNPDSEDELLHAFMPDATASPDQRPHPI